METNNLKFSKLNTLNEEDYKTLSHLIVDTWLEQEVDNLEEINAMTDFLINTLLLTSSEIFIARDSEKIVGVIAATLTQNLLETSKIRRRQLTSLSFIINHGIPTTLLDYYLETLKLNEDLLQQANKEFDASLNFLILDKTYQGKGIGNKLYQLFIDYLKKQNAKTFFLWTDSSSNYQFYDKKGLSRLVEKSMSYQSGNEDETHEEIEEFYLYEGYIS